MVTQSSAGTPPHEEQTTGPVSRGDVTPAAHETAGLRRKDTTVPTQSRSTRVRPAGRRVALTLAAAVSALAVTVTAFAAAPSGGRRSPSSPP